MSIQLTTEHHITRLHNAEAVLTSTHNLCFEQEYETYQNVLSEKFLFLVVEVSIYWNRPVFVMKNMLQTNERQSSWFPLSQQSLGQLRYGNAECVCVCVWWEGARRREWIKVILLVPNLRPRFIRCYKIFVRLTESQSHSISEAPRKQKNKQNKKVIIIIIIKK